jgi:hypothetical protein
LPGDGGDREHDRADGPPHGRGAVTNLELGAGQAP